MGRHGERDVTGVTAIMAGMGGGDRLTLAGYTDSALATAPATAGVGYQLTSGGKEQGGIGTASSILYSDIGDWVTPTSNANLYEARATLNSGAVSSGTTGSWLALTSTRTWTVTRSVIGTASANLTIEIRLAGGPGTILASATVSMTADVS